MRCLLLPSLLAASIIIVAAACARPPPSSATKTSARMTTTAPSSSTETACASCHAQQAAEWDASLHHASFTDRDFQISFHAEPMPFCFGCHAPQATNTKDERGAALGVGCTSCHSVDREHGTKNTVATTASDCSSCHEFSFPNKPTLMQSTVAEHRASAFAEVSCATCHLPKQADGHRDHRFHVTRNETLLRKSITLDAQRTKTGGVLVTLTTNGVGHAMPTGDLFRRLRVSLHALATDGTLVDEREALLGRRDFDQPTERDDRIVGKRQITFEGGALVSAKTIEIDVRYERVAQTSAHADRVFSSLIIAESSP